MSGTGATYRDFFAIHAPWPIPDWFEPRGLPVEPTAMMTPDEYFNDPVNNASTYDAAFRYYVKETNTWLEDDYTKDTGDVITSDQKYNIISYYGAYDYRQAEIAAWQVDYEKEKYFQWRWHFADEMLVARGGGNIS